MVRCSVAVAVAVAVTVLFGRGSFVHAQVFAHHGILPIRIGRQQRKVPAVVGCFSDDVGGGDKTTTDSIAGVRGWTTTTMAVPVAVPVAVLLLFRCTPVSGTTGGCCCHVRVAVLCGMVARTRRIVAIGRRVNHQ